ncbi:MFS transporter [Actinoplanes sp. TRM 88003]|uniref:MFS transporter n=1 Tax=Paractinoplanes aksuensis TaxID=2939490 RepID=A0ABT1DWH1_9ACTN|nr:MFS transporter [Actinoplanes aksuensis]MCO8274300.1 MFS transporter [Actinoplanes aksuensis]
MEAVAGAPAKVREARVQGAAALANGPRELLDFVLPLWAGAAVGASATQVGLLVAVELAVSMAARPVAGWLADVRDRRRVAAVGALLYALSCVGYAFAGDLAIAFGSAAVGGVGGALLWVSVRAMAAERLAEDSAVFAKLTAAEENGSWIAFVAGLTLLQVAGYRYVFLACAAACLLAAAALLSAPARVVPPAPPLPGSTWRRLRPMLLAVVITIAAEAAIGLLLLLHLQRHFELEVVQIAYVFLPGAIVMALLPTWLHRFVVRYGRTRVLAVASVSSAVFAAALAWSPPVVVIAGLWILSGVAWAAVIPIQQAVIAEASGARVGRGMGAYEAAVLLGALIGSVAAGVLYDAASWALACAVAAAVILSGAVLVPWSVRAVGVPDIPPPPPPVVAPKPEGTPHPDTTSPNTPHADTTPADATRVDTPPADAPHANMSPADASRVDTPAEVPPVRARHGATPAGDATGAEPRPEPKPARSPYRRLIEHAAIYTIAQIVLLVLAESWLLDLARGSGDALNGTREGGESFVYAAGRSWTFIIVIDLVWTLIAARRARRKPQ